MDETRNDDWTRGDYDETGERANPREGAGHEGRDFTAPLGAVTRGRLEFAGGASRATITADAAPADLYRAHFEGPTPDVQVRDGIVTIRYPRFWPFGWAGYARPHTTEIALNASILWEIALRGGASQLDADLGGLRLRALEINGGASRVEVTLPRPEGAVAIRVGGGASRLTLHHPEGVALRVHVGGGVSRLVLDEQRFGAIGGGMHWQTPDYAGATDRYEIEIVGGASVLTLDVR